MEDISKRSLKMTRTFDAPVDLLWKVLTTSELIKKWWGPEGFTITIDEMDVRVGGKWSFTMHGPDGSNYENRYVYSELIPMQKIVLDHVTGPKFSIIITIHEEAEHTKVQWSNVFDSVPSLEEAINAFKADEGLKQNLERLSKQISAIK